MSGLMDAVRSVLGLSETPPSNAAERSAIEMRLREQAARLKAMDAQVDAQRAVAHMQPRRRITDHR